MPIGSIQPIVNISQSLFNDTKADATTFFRHLFAKQELTEHLISRSFGSSVSLIELVICIALMVLTFWLSRWILARRSTEALGQRQFIRHLIHRITWPFILLLAAIGTMYAWNITGHDPLWLKLLVMAARWMLIIHMALAILHAVIPDNRFSENLERSLAVVLWITFVLWLSGIDAIIVSILKSMVIPLGSDKINMYSVLTGLISVCVVVVLALWVSKLLENRLMMAQGLDLNLRLVLSKVVKTILVAIAILAALPMVGIDLTVLSVFGGALGVGLGFGLQKVASNYVSGFIILSDRSIRLGDRLTVDNFTGYVTKITARFVVLRSVAGTEALVPNDNFVSSTVINESFTSKALWTSLDVQVAYKTDLPEALAIMQAAAASQERVAEDPPPNSFLVDFADSGITLRVGYWLTDPENGFLGINSVILLDIWRQFNQNGIEFPFPQREVRILNQAQAGVDEAALLASALLARQNTHSSEPGPGDDGSDSADADGH